MGTYLPSKDLSLSELDTASPRILVRAWGGRYRDVLCRVRVGLGFEREGMQTELGSNGFEKHPVSHSNETRYKYATQTHQQHGRPIQPRQPGRLLLPPRRR